LKIPKRILLPAIVGIIILAPIILAIRSDDASLPTARLAAPPADLSGFTRAAGPTEIIFPRDNGPHTDYLTEWWYYTGNLETADGRHFGFQLTFFRRALAPQTEISGERASDWAADQVYLAHFALTDVAGETFTARERFSRGAAGLAGAQAEPYRVWLEDWSVMQAEDGVYQLTAFIEGTALNLRLVDATGPILHGEDGYSQKGPEPGNASYYISQPRLEASGTVTAGGETFAVTGLAWMDHEYSTSALGADQVGWDWFSIQLDDGTAIMLFELRKEDGTVDAFSSGTIIFPDGQVQFLGEEDFTISVEEWWDSPHSGARYPAQWIIAVPGAGIDLSVSPWLADQELQVSFTYWEGAVQVEGTVNGAAVSGAGYVELTGYAHSMQGEF